MTFNKKLLVSFSSRLHTLSFSLSREHTYFEDDVRVPAKLHMLKRNDEDINQKFRSDQSKTTKLLRFRLKE